jgi:hypothetical protein
MNYYEKKFFLRPGEKFEIENLFGVFGWWVISGKGKILDVDFGEEYEIFSDDVHADNLDHSSLTRIEIKGENIIFSADENTGENLVFVFFLYKL